MQVAGPVFNAPVTRPKRSIPWLFLAALAVVLRFGPIGSGLPYCDYIDEAYNLRVATHILKPTIFHAEASSYPPLTSYLAAAAIKAYAPFYRLFHHHKLWKDLPTERELYTNSGEQYDLLTPPEIIWLGRLVMACLSLGTVLVAGTLAKDLGGSRAGLLTMLFTALCPALVSRASNVIVDTTATFFAVATLFFCQRLRAIAPSNTAAQWRGAVGAGIAAGLAFAGKYPVGAVFAAVLVTIFGLRIGRITKTILVVIAAAGLLIGVVCGVPDVVVHPGKIPAWLPAIMRFYQSIRSEQSYWTAAVSPAEVGVPLVTAGLAGIIWMLWNSSTRAVAASWLAFALLLIAAVAGSSFQPFRNLLSLVPPLCIAAGLLCNWLWGYLENRSRPFAFHRWVAPAFALFLAFSLAWPAARHLRSRMLHVDARIRAIDWLQEHVSKEDTVLGLRELAILPAEWQRLAANVTIVSWVDAATRLERDRFDYVVTGQLDLRYAPDPERLSAALGRWKQVAAPFPVQAEFGSGPVFVLPYLWHITDERIVILQANAPKRIED